MSNTYKNSAYRPSIWGDIGIMISAGLAGGVLLGQLTPTLSISGFLLGVAGGAWLTHRGRSSITGTGQIESSPKAEGDADA